MISLKHAAITAIGLTGLLSLGACSTVPNALSGKFASVTPQQAQTGQDKGYAVRWGGLIVDTKPGKTQTCFRVMGTLLGSNGEPLAASQSNLQGRFLACAKGFYDPQLYSRGRRITLVGTINDLQHEKVGNYEYPYPRLEANVVYLWPREPVRPQTNVYYMNGWWGPYGGWGWWPWLGYSTWGAPLPYDRDPGNTYPHDPPHATPPPDRMEPRAPHPAGRPQLERPLPRDFAPIHGFHPQANPPRPERLAPPITHNFINHDRGPRHHPPMA